MSATPPAALEGTHTPSPFEVLWERYRSLVLTVLGALFLALVGNYAWKYFERAGIDEKWGKFYASVGLDETYVNIRQSFKSLGELLEGTSLSDLEAALPSATDVQKPYVLLAIARKAMLESNWERARSALDNIESSYADHLLVRSTPYPVQSRDPQELPEDKSEMPDEPQFQPAAEGSIVAMMREQIDASQQFTMPERFQMPEIPADATRVRFEFGDYGSFTLALMPQAPKHREAFLELAKQGEGWWKGVAVDEIQRPTENNPFQARSLHFGFASTKEDDRTKWTTTEPSEHQVEYEETGLSHFPGAVAARNEAEGESCANRLWISVDDQAEMDNSRVVFAYVVEGLDTLRSVCEADMSAQEEEAGRGRPTENIRITAVTVVE